MSAVLHLIDALDSRWDEWLERAPHDFQHTSGYHRLSESAGEGAAWLAVYGDPDRFVAWPYLLRPVESGLGTFTDVTSVYGYPGPIESGVVGNAEFLQSAWHTLNQVWQSQAAVAAFTRFHPLLRNQTVVPENARSGVVSTGCTVSIDLRKSEAARCNDYKRQLQQHIRRSREAGIVTEFDRDWKYLAAFQSIYYSTMDRNRASDYYYFSEEYFRCFREALGDLGMLAVSRLDGVIICASLVIECAGIINAHLAGTLPEYLPLSPFKLLVHDLSNWGHQRGDTALHLGGGRGGRQDSLFRFKSEFSPRRHDFSVGKWVLQPDVYSALSNGRMTDYFPAYREPTAAPEHAVSVSRGERHGELAVSSAD